MHQTTRNRNCIEPHHTTVIIDGPILTISNIVHHLFSTLTNIYIYYAYMNAFYSKILYISENSTKPISNTLSKCAHFHLTIQNAIIIIVIGKTDIIMAIIIMQCDTPHISFTFTCAFSWTKGHPNIDNITTKLYIL